jgi:predicted ATPase
MNQKYIITGAPGTGKTAIINALKKEGHSCAEEISRTIITQEIASGGDALPWKNLATFSQQVIALRKHNILMPHKVELIFLIEELLM